jgi:hypothetical protein
VTFPARRSDLPGPPPVVPSSPADDDVGSSWFRCRAAAGPGLLIRFRTYWYDLDCDRACTVVIEEIAAVDPARNDVIIIGGAS